MLTQFWGQNYGHVLLTAEAGTLPMDKDFLLKEFGLHGQHSSQEYLACHAKLGEGGYIRLVWETDVNGTEFDPKGRNTAAIFEIYFGKEADDCQSGRGQSLGHGSSSNQQTTDPRERTCLRRAGLRKVRACVLHLNYMEAKKPKNARDWLCFVFRQCMEHGVDIIAGDANSAASTFYKRQEFCDIDQSSFHCVPIHGWLLQ